jgi:tetratricopeptide (TPR) repeat protein
MRRFGKGGAMRRYLTLLFAVVLAALLVSTANAQFSNSGVPGAQQGDVHSPSSPNFLPLLPNQPIQYKNSRFGVNNYQVSFFHGGDWSGWGYGWTAAYPYWYPYPGPVVLPPLYLPAEEIYGPQAVRRFMGIDGPPASAPVVIINNADRDRDVGAKPKPRITNAAMKAQAGKFMAFGDANFSKQKYNSAFERYRTAAQSASDIPEPFLRQGFALIAMGRYDAAAKVMRRALLLAPNPNQWRLNLDELYGDNRIAKSAHLETLAQAVEQSPQSADLLLLLGLYLYFDGQRQRALPVFQRCEQIGGNFDGALNELLREAPKKAAGEREI